MKILFFITFSILLFSCGDSNVESPSKRLDPEVSEVILDIRSLQDLTGQGLILQSVTPVEFSKLNQILIKTEAILRRLSNEPKDQIALNSLLSLYQAIKEFPFTDVDRSYFLDLNSKVENVLVNYANIQGVILGDLNRYLTTFTFNFESGLEGWTQVTEVGNTELKFSPKSYGSDFYVRISSFINNGNNLVGTQRLISPQIKLSSDAFSEVQIAHAFKFYTPENQSLNLLQLQVRIIGEEWQEIILPKLPAGNSYDAEESGFIKLSKSFIGKTVEFSFVYKSTDAINPLWDIHNIEVRADYGN